MSDICICAYVVPRLSLPPAGLIEICDINKNETSKWFFYCFQLQKEREKKEEEEKQQVNLENDARVFFFINVCFSQFCFQVSNLVKVIQ